MASGLVRRGARRKRRNRSTCRVPTFVFRLLSWLSSVPDSFHLNQATVEGGSAAVVGEALAGDGIDVAAAGGALGPADGRGTDHAGADASIDVGFQGEGATVVEDARSEERRVGKDSKS